MFSLRISSLHLGRVKHCVYVVSDAANAKDSRKTDGPSARGELSLSSICTSAERATERVRPSVPAVIAIRTKKALLATGDERVPPTRERKRKDGREEGRARARYRSERAYPLDAHLNAALRHRVNGNGRCYPRRNRRRRRHPLSSCPCAGRDATSTAAARRDPGVDCSPSPSRSSSSRNEGTRNTYYTRSREGVRARSYAPRSRAYACARVCNRVAPAYSDLLARVAHNPTTATPRRATRSTDTGQNGARHCPATPTPERARSSQGRNGRQGGRGASGRSLPTSHCDA